MIKLVLLSMALVSMACLCAGVRPPYVGCQTSEECGKESCCVIGMGLYTIPRCEARRDLAEDCRPHGVSVNVTLVYLDKSKVDLKDVYYMMCPCQSALTCYKDDTGDDVPRCMEGFLENHLYNDY